MSSDIKHKLRLEHFDELINPDGPEAAERIEALECEVHLATITNNGWINAYEKAVAQVDALKHDIARHMEIANAAEARAARLRVALRLYEKAEKVGTSDAYEVAHNIRKIELEDGEQLPTS